MKNMERGVNNILDLFREVFVQHLWTINFQHWNFIAIYPKLDYNIIVVGKIICHWTLAIRYTMNCYFTLFTRTWLHSFFQRSYVTGIYSSSDSFVHNDTGDRSWHSQSLRYWGWAEQSWARNLEYRGLTSVVDWTFLLLRIVTNP